MNSLTPPSLDISVRLGYVKRSKHICPSFGARGTAMLIGDRLGELREAKVSRKEKLLEALCNDCATKGEAKPS